MSQEELMVDIECISPALKSKRNPIYKKTDKRQMLMLIAVVPMLIASLAGAIVLENIVISLGFAFACLVVISLMSKTITEIYWRCPQCGNSLPSTWNNVTGANMLMCFVCIPVYIETCSKCGHSLVGGKPPLPEEEILEDKRKQRRKTAWILGVAGLGLFIELLIVLVLVKKGKI